MARVTVEDCVMKVPNRFELVVLAAQRSRTISAGAPLSIDRDNDKNPVVALREIADDTIELEELEDNVIRGMQKHVEIDEPEDEDPIEFMAGAAMVGETDGINDDVASTVKAPQATEALQEKH